VPDALPRIREARRRAAAHSCSRLMARCRGRRSFIPSRTHRRCVGSRYSCGISKWWS
jgi:hypothetical protein